TMIIRPDGESTRHAANGCAHAAIARPTTSSRLSTGSVFRIAVRNVLSSCLTDRRIELARSRPRRRPGFQQLRGRVARKSTRGRTLVSEFSRSPPVVFYFGHGIRTPSFQSAAYNRPCGHAAPEGTHQRKFALG